MAPPLLPITRLVACSACAEHIKSNESACPHCGAEVRGPEGRVGRAATAVLMGLALSGCPDKDPGPTSSATESGTSTGTDGGSTAGETDDTGTDSEVSSTAMPEPEYGVPVTTSGSGEQDYGVPATDSMSGTGDTDPTESSSGGGPEPLYGAGGVV